MRYIILLLIVISCNNNGSNIDLLINKTLEINKIKSPIIVHKTKNNDFLKQSLFIKLLNTEELIETNNDGFYSLNIVEKESLIIISLSNYKTGFDYVTTFNKKENLKVISNKVFQTKRIENKPFYIFMAIMKKKHPKYMDWNNFEIPADSLKDY